MPTKTFSAFPPHGVGDTIIEDSFKRQTYLPTPEDIMDNWLWGIPKESALTQEKLTTTIVRHYIDSAISEIEHDLGLFISPISIVREQHPFNWNDVRNNFCPFKLQQKPLIRVDKIEFRVMGSAHVSAMSSTYDEATQTSYVEMPVNWLSINHASNQINLIPVMGSRNAMNPFFASLFRRTGEVSFQHFPGFFLLSYTCGFEEKLPIILNELITVTAVQNIISMIGPALFPSSSYSISIDGLSQGATLPGHNWLNSRLSELSQKKERLLIICRKFYNISLNSVVLG